MFSINSFVTSNSYSIVSQVTILLKYPCDKAVSGILLDYIMKS